MATRVSSLESPLGPSSMDHTPERNVRSETVTFAVAPNENRSPRRSSRIKKNPSITPNRFTRFFTPRPQNVKRSVRTSRKALRELSAVNLNSRSGAKQSLEVCTGEHSQPPSKKRKLSFTSIPSIPSSPIKVNYGFPSSQESPAGEGAMPDAKDDDALYSETDDEDEEEELSPLLQYPPRVTRYQSISTSAGLLSRHLGRRKEISFGNDSNLWQHETSNFYSLPEDFFNDTSINIRPRALPFCTASFNHQQSVAIGNEDGLVEVYRASERSSDDPGSLQIQYFMYPHDNAIMDMEFSYDDKFLATASGDQSCRIIDMDTLMATHTLIGHMGSIKRVQWQPGSGNHVLATCSRDGSVRLWDLRCAQQGILDIQPLVRAPHLLNNSREVNAQVEIRDAHTSWDKLKLVNGKRQVAGLSSKVDFAVTTCAFISDTRPHMLATASEHNAIIKIWDMRASYKQRSGRPTPVSATLEPNSHEALRPFGVTSMVMNTDGSRLYTLCRDNTIYAYSTAHLVLGGCPEMSLASSQPSRASRTAGQGLGPLYGFRDPSLRLGSFYDKLALRRKTSENTEILAAGSGEDCAVIFPTDERYLTKAARRCPPVVSHSKPSLRSRPRLPQRASSVNMLSNSLSASTSFQDVQMEGQCPIYYTGTPLINGHTKEVTAVAWVHHNGQLITVADDYKARCWFEDDPSKARALRLNTERDGRRNQSGWATVRPGFDDDEDKA
ncbi:uncharacterized protein Z519_08574 [Cladophialophora bantiana CBS 173.52]|uniref:Anaphase-promoting complex subunit 4 WD40 domain-containing protein n=1 Tax=Cladophialophora bantiana (strain ATCC 10958 / CBS 173.52 / CDC B-1940 / NIH 8579) TaxID=1442370 RepID=A0A0D2ELA2_CLAB1|nr:uncharacterized protein Z519_08574 [Cladophialophora bantiana CBS 173.52]KIW90791.1 hypothetical protein Z519_08574 [Cladophialophora bantiana CBS 173.52]